MGKLFRVWSKCSLRPVHRRGSFRFAPGCCCGPQGPDTTGCDLSNFPCATTIPNEWEITVPVGTFPTACGFLDPPCCCTDKEGLFVLTWKSINFDPGEPTCDWYYCHPTTDGDECPFYGPNGGRPCANVLCNCCPSYFWKLHWGPYDASNKELVLSMEHSLQILADEVNPNDCDAWVMGTVTDFSFWTAIIPNSTDCMTIDEELAWFADGSFPTCVPDNTKTIRCRAIS